MEKLLLKQLWILLFEIKILMSIKADAVITYQLNSNLY